MGRAISAVVVLLLLSTGCVHKEPETQPAPSAATPETSKPAPATAAKAPASTAQPKGTAGAKPGTAPTTKTAAAPATKGKTAPPVAKAPAATKPQPAPAPAAAATLDLEALKTQLRNTKAIGVFTKLTLKNQVDDLLDKFREHHAGKPTPTMTELRRSYDLLMMKVLSLLQDSDQRLASEIVSSRERIWGLLADPKKFAALQA
jgi:hypothetical protein